MTLNLPSSLLLQLLPLLPPSFPNFLLWACQVNQSSQLHSPPSIPLFGFSPKLFLFPLAQGTVSLLTSFSDKFPLSVSPMLPSWVQWPVLLRTVHSPYEAGPKSGIAWLLCSFSQDSHLVLEKSKILHQRFGIFLHCIWYLQRLGFYMVSLPSHLLCPNLSGHCFLQLFPRSSLPYGAIGGLVEIIMASLWWALTCIVLNILRLLLYSVLQPPCEA